jgi:hypothetical protein
VIRWLCSHCGGSHVGSLNTPVKWARRSSNRSAVAACSVGAGALVSVAFHTKRQPLCTNAMVRRPKSHRIDPNALSHWTPSTMSNEPRVRP